MKIFVKINKTENSTKSAENQKSVEPYTNPIANTQQKPQQIKSSSYSDSFTRQTKSLYLEMRQNFSEVFSIEQTQAEKERLVLQYPKKIHAAN